MDLAGDSGSSRKQVIDLLVASWNSVRANVVKIRWMECVIKNELCLNHKLFDSRRNA